MKKSRKGYRRDARKKIHGLEFERVMDRSFADGSTPICYGCYAEEIESVTLRAGMCEALNKKYLPCYKMTEIGEIAIFKLKGGDKDIST